MTRSETDQRRALPHEYRYDGYHEVCVSHCSLSSPLASSALGALPLSCQPILQDIAALSPPVAHLSMAKVNSFSRSLSLSLSLSLYGVQDDFFNQLPIDYGVRIRRVLYLPAGVQHDSSNPHLTFLFRRHFVCWAPMSRATTNENSSPVSLSSPRFTWQRIVILEPFFTSIQIF